MSHVTYIIDKDGSEHKVLTQQYAIGLYVIEDDDPMKQRGIEDADEIQFHKYLREKFEYNKEKSSVL